VEALAALTAELLHDVVLPLPLDPLGDEPRAQSVPETDDRAQERAAIGVAVDGRREAAVDLDDVDREALEVRQ